MRHFETGGIATDSTIEWNWSGNGAFLPDPATGFPVWVSWYDGSVTIDVGGGWIVVDAAGNYLDQQTDFIDWPNIAGVQCSIILPRPRLGHALRTSLGESLVFAGDGGEYDHYTLSSPEGGAMITVVDETTGEFSPEFWLSNDTTYYDLVNGYPQQPLLLKISATRWSNNLQIRCTNATLSVFTPLEE